MKSTKVLNGRITKKKPESEIIGTSTLVKKEIGEVKLVTPVLSLDLAGPHVGTSSSDDVQLLDTALSHLIAADARFAVLAKRFRPIPWTQPELSAQSNHFQSLALSIMSQQVSGAAARSISSRFIALFSDQTGSQSIKVELDPEIEDGMLSSAPTSSATSDFFPGYHTVADSDPLFLKTAGLSLRKAEYVKGVAQAFVDGRLSDEFFASATDQEIFDRLVSIRGLGPWTAEMFLMFSLKRTDVLSTRDIGLQRGMSYWSGRNPKDKSTHHKGAHKYLTVAEMTELTDPWRPYRSIGCWFMWRVDSAMVAEPL